MTTKPRKRRGEPVDIRQEVIETLEMLLAADWRKWEELASPDEFVRWAKSRANYALSIINEAPQPAEPVTIPETVASDHSEPTDSAGYTLGPVSDGGLDPRDRAALAERKRRGEPVAPEGFRLIAVNETFDSLMFWLNRCEQKGHLENCADLVEPWEAFGYRDVETLQPAEPVCPVCPECGGDGAGGEHEEERVDFDAWWEKEGQYCRAGGGDYEKTFAYRAYQAGRSAQQSQDREA